MKEDWEIKKLGDIVDIINGKNQSQVISDDGKYPIYGSGGNIMGYATDYICEKGTTIIGRKGNISNPIFIDERFWNVDTAFGIYPKNQSDPKFINYLCQTIDFKSRNKGTTIPSLVKSDLQTIEIPFPKSLPEQQRIVSILDEAFSAIARAKANAEQNLKNAAALFESYLQGVFENKGEGWEENTLSQLFDVKHGFAFQGEFFSNLGEYVLLTPGNFFEEGGYRDRGEKQKYYIGEIPSDFILQKGDLLVAMTEQAAGLLGSPIIVPASNKFLHNQRLGLIIPKQNVEIDNEFFFHVFNLKRVRKALHDSGTGVKVRHTSPTKIGQVEISYPKSLKEQQTIVRQLDALRAETQKLEAIYRQKILNLEELKKSVLQKAFNGEL